MATPQAKQQCLMGANCPLYLADFHFHQFHGNPATCKFGASCKFLSVAGQADSIVTHLRQFGHESSRNCEVCIVEVYGEKVLRKMTCNRPLRDNQSYCDRHTDFRPATSVTATSSEHSARAARTARTARTTHGAPKTPRRNNGPRAAKHAPPQSIFAGWHNPRPDFDDELVVGESD